MPRGDNPNSRANLKPFKKLDELKKDKRTEKEQRKVQKKGGKTSGEVRAAKLTFREMAESDSPEEKERMWAAVKRLAMSGDLRAFELYRDTIGEKPKDELNVSGQLTNPYSGLTEEELRRLAGGDCE